MTNKNLGGPMKTLFTAILLTLSLSTSTFAFTGGYDSNSEVKLSEDVTFENLQQYGMWECEAQAANGAGGFGQGYSRLQAANAAVYNCQMYAGYYFAPSCRVFSCGRF